MLGNVERIVAHRQNVPDSAELVAEVAGSEEIWEHPFRADERWTRKGSGKADLCSKRRGHQFVIAPDTIKQLRVGQAVVIQKEPHSAKRAALLAPGSARPHARDGPHGA